MTYNIAKLIGTTLSVALLVATNAGAQQLETPAERTNFRAGPTMYDDLMEFVMGPDFPTGGYIVGKEGVKDVYRFGRGRITIRGEATIEEMRGARHRIVITEIPFQTNLTTLIERIADLARSGRLKGVADLRDESDRNGLSIILELRKGAQPRTVLNQLYKFTPLMTTFSTQILALVGGEPHTLTLKRSLQILFLPITIMTPTKIIY